MAQGVILSAFFVLVLVPRPVQGKAASPIVSNNINQATSQQQQGMGHTGGQMRRVSLLNDDTRTDSRLERFGTDSLRWQPRAQSAAIPVQIIDDRFHQGRRSVIQPYSVVALGRRVEQSPSARGIEVPGQVLSEDCQDTNTLDNQMEISGTRLHNHQSQRSLNQYSFSPAQEVPSVASEGHRVGYGSGLTSGSSAWEPDTEGRRPDSEAPVRETLVDNWRPSWAAGRRGLSVFRRRQTAAMGDEGSEPVLLDGAGSEDFPVLSAVKPEQMHNSVEGSRRPADSVDPEHDRYHLRVRAPTSNGNVVQVFSTVRGLHAAERIQAAERISLRVRELLRYHGVSVQDDEENEEEEGENGPLEVREEEAVAYTLSRRMLGMLFNDGQEEQLGREERGESGESTRGGVAAHQTGGPFSLTRDMARDSLLARDVSYSKDLAQQQAQRLSGR
eukprot:CAMPEP_0181324302 /NCGR_PEP_ID=MMETSP1101-20121128/20282_1 /TAXON_ID=46948 /ORGANISM="Rhodomonas abbreviata, Strain Caron Lab Isolate" /LENGTH=443 /DNA_ID=CAMNT_0023432459 /DNA_START=133 /DNA_END=1461 /DNA_ORIENTATION=+